MAWYYDGYGDRIHVPNGDPRFNGDEFFYRDPAPVSFSGTPPFYDDGVNDRRYFHNQYPAFSHGGELILPRERVLIRREDPYPCPTTGAWWHNPDHPHNGCIGWVMAERPPENDEEDSTVLEFYAPQLHSESCQRRVEDALRECPGVVNVFADQWERKVVVVGNGLREEHVLRLLKRVHNMERSVLWRNHQC